VRAAAGADLSSGDEVVVHALPFAPPTVPSSSSRPRVTVRALVAAALVIACIAALCAFLLRPQLTSRAAPDRSAATAMHRALQRELPQTAAYILSSMPPRVREQVLREYPNDQRERIQRHLNGRARG
jgi:flagellar biosynthesis/type III secretory pathway M-ring protein FliF/YscJ